MERERSKPGCSLQCIQRATTGSSSSRARTTNKDTLKGDGKRELLLPLYREARFVKINSLARFRSRFKARALLFSRESEREDEEKKNNVTRIFQILRQKIVRRSCPKRLFRIIITRRFLSLTPERRVHKTLRSHCSLCFSPSSSIASFLTRSKKRESMMPSSRSNEDARHKVSRSLSLCL